MDINMDAGTSSYGAETKQSKLTDRRRMWGLVLGAVCALISALYLLIYQFLAFEALGMVNSSSAMPGLLATVYYILTFVSGIFSYLAFVAVGVLGMAASVSYPDPKGPLLLKAYSGLVTSSLLVVAGHRVIEFFFNSKYGKSAPENFLRIIQPFVFAVACVGFALSVLLALKKGGPKVKSKAGDIYLLPLVFAICMYISHIFGIIADANEIIWDGTNVTFFVLWLFVRITTPLTLYLCFAYPISFLLPYIGENEATE